MYKTLECRPDTYQAWYGQGDRLRKQHCYQEALISYGKALEYNPRDYWAWYHIAGILETVGNYREAIAHYQQAVTLKPNNYWAWYEQGCIYLEELAEYEKAIASFE